MPIGIDGSVYQWVDLNGEGMPGLLFEQAGESYYKRNLSPANIVNGQIIIGPIKGTTITAGIYVTSSSNFRSTGTRCSR